MSNYDNTYNRGIKIHLGHYLLMLSVPFCVSLLLNILVISSSKWWILDRQSLSQIDMLRLLDVAPEEKFMASVISFPVYNI